MKPKQKAPTRAITHSIVFKANWGRIGLIRLILDFDAYFRPTLDEGD
jgi:hypothetical protein